MKGEKKKERKLHRKNLPKKCPFFTFVPIKVFFQFTIQSVITILVKLEQIGSSMGLLLIIHFYHQRVLKEPPRIV